MNTSKKFKLNTVCLAIFAVLGTNTYAQDAVQNNNKDKEQEEIEVIEVTGLRGSLIKSLNDKRFSSNRHAVRNVFIVNIVWIQL